MKFLRYLAAIVMLSGAALANSAYPSYSDSAYPTRASLSTMTKATALTGTYKHVCIIETGYAGCYDAIADSTATIDGVTVLAFADAPATGRWVKNNTALFIGGMFPGAADGWSTPVDGALPTTSYAGNALTISTKGTCSPIFSGAVGSYLGLLSCQRYADTHQHALHVIEQLPGLVTYVSGDFLLQPTAGTSASTSVDLVAWCQNYGTWTGPPSLPCAAVHLVTQNTSYIAEYIDNTGALLGDANLSGILDTMIPENTLFSVAFTLDQKSGRVCLLLPDRPYWSKDRCDQQTYFAAYPSTWAAQEVYIAVPESGDQAYVRRGSATSADPATIGIGAQTTAAVPGIVREKIAGTAQFVGCIGDVSGCTNSGNYLHASTSDVAYGQLQSGQAITGAGVAAGTVIISGGFPLFLLNNNSLVARENLIADLVSGLTIPKTATSYGAVTFRVPANASAYSPASLGLTPPLGEISVRACAAFVADSNSKVMASFVFSAAGSTVSPGVYEFPLATGVNPGETKCVSVPLPLPLNIQTGGVYTVDYRIYDANVGGVSSFLTPDANNGSWPRPTITVTGMNDNVGGN